MTQTLLLDTHAFVWALRSPELLGQRAVQAIGDPDASLLVSASSVWELAIKHHAGRWPAAAAIVADLAGVLRELGAYVWPITATHAVRAGTMAWRHTDPFDRMLAAIALVDRCTLVTKDRAFRSVPGLDVLW